MVKCDTLEWRGTGTAILRGTDEAQALLEDHIMKLQAMRASPYITHFLERLLMWDKKLNLTQVRGRVLAACADTCVPGDAHDAVSWWRAGDSDTHACARTHSHI